MRHQLVQILALHVGWEPMQLQQGPPVVLNAQQGHTRINYPAQHVSTVQWDILLREMRHQVVIHVRLGPMLPQREPVVVPHAQ